MIFRKSEIFQIFRKFDQPGKKIWSSKIIFFKKSQNFIERPFRNTQQRLLTPPERGERAISTWSSKWFLRNFGFWLNLCTHTCCFPLQFSLSKRRSVWALQKIREPRLLGVGWWAAPFWKVHVQSFLRKTIRAVKLNGNTFN